MKDVTVSTATWWQNGVGPGLGARVGLSKLIERFRWIFRHRPLLRYPSGEADLQPIEPRMTEVGYADAWSSISKSSSEGSGRAHPINMITPTLQ
jgi:hypothetical protein